MSRVFQSRKLVPFFLGAATTLLLLNAPEAVVQVQNLIFPRPTVPTEWVKARCFEYLSNHGPAASWPAAGPHRWYFWRLRFGIREFQLEGTREHLLVISPDGDGPRVYLLTPERELLVSTDDAMSLAAEWALVKEESMTPERILHLRSSYKPVP